MVQLTCIFFLIGIFYKVEPLLLKRNVIRTGFNPHKNDLKRPPRAVYAIGTGDNYIMTKIAETNHRLSTIEGTLFRMENLLNFLHLGPHKPGVSHLGGQGVGHPAVVVHPGVGQPIAGHPVVGFHGQALPHPAGINKIPTQSGLVGAPTAAPAVAAPAGAAPAVGAPAGPAPMGPLPASRNALIGPPDTGDTNSLHSLLEALAPPQPRHRFQNLAQEIQALLPKQPEVPEKNDDKPRKVHWMDSKCSEPCGIANGPKPTSAPAVAVAGVGKSVAQAVVRRLIRKRAAPADENPDSIEVTQMRVVGGDEAMKHKYPWQVYIQMHLDSGTARCGGSIINDRYVITAGHCTYTGDRACAIKLQPGKMTVTVAEHNINSMNDDIRGVTDRIDVKRIIRHPKYCNSVVEMDNDVALLQLSEVLYLPDIREIGHICLPVGPSDDFSGMTATVAGWGYKEEDFSERTHHDLAGKLQEVNFKIHPDCSPYPDPEDITENMICAGDEKNTKDACGGDSGGPLMVQKEGQYTLAGLVSFGPEGGDCTGEGVYVKLANYIDWIRENTKDAGC